MSDRNISGGNPLVVVAASGYFNPLHTGHLEYLYDAKNYGDVLVVIVNNDKQVLLKNQILFLDEDERLEIIRSLDCVDCAILSIDEDLSITKTLEALNPDIFMNGGDRTKPNKQEEKVCKTINCEMKYNIGGRKIQFSSRILDQYFYKRKSFGNYIS